MNEKTVTVILELKEKVYERDTSTNTKKRNYKLKKVTCRAEFEGRVNLNDLVSKCDPKIRVIIDNGDILVEIPLDKTGSKGIQEILGELDIGDRVKLDFKLEDKYKLREITIF